MQAQATGARWTSGSREKLAGLGVATSKGCVDSLGQFPDLKEGAGKLDPNFPQRPI